MKFLQLTEWRKYQHYKNRNPPWIKLHRDLLTSYTWTVLDDASRALAIACMILASETDNKIPLDRDFIQRRGQFKKCPDIRQLLEVGFAEVIDIPTVANSASTMQADASNLHCNHSPEVETERETELEIFRAPRKKATRIPEDFVPKEEHHLLSRELGVNCEMEFQKFRDYFLGVAGAKGVKLDWDATLRNWLKNSLTYGGGNGGRPSKTQQRVINNRAAITRELLSHRAGAGLGGEHSQS